MGKKVFFLGAGFSKAVNSTYPLMKELTENVQKYLEKGSLAYHYDEIAPLVKEDVESLLTYLSVDFPWKRDYTKHENMALYSKIIEIISKRFEKLSECKEDYDDLWLKFAKYINAHVEDYSFITLNYDVLLEQLLFKGLKQENDGAYEFLDDSYSYPMTYICERDGSIFGGSLSSEKIPPILKLHGSANWFWSGINPSDTLYYRVWKDVNETERVLRGLKPYIIPPVMDKNAFYNHVAIRWLWEQAEKVLREAEEIYIVGFSFPKTDLSVKYLFQSALRYSKAKIYVINVADYQKSLKTNYEVVFGKDKVIDKYTGKPNITKVFIKNFISSGL